MKLTLHIKTRTADGKFVWWYFTEVPFWSWVRAKLRLHKRFNRIRELLRRMSARYTKEETLQRWPDGIIWTAEDGMKAKTENEESKSINNSTAGYGSRPSASPSENVLDSLPPS